MTSPDINVRHAGPVQALWTRWWLGVALLVVGALVGLALGSTRPTNYTAESRLVVGNDDLSSYEVAGFATASEQLASNYARYVDNSSVVSRQLDKDLGGEVSDLVGISASPITSSDVVSVEVTGTARSAAIDGAKSIAATLVRLTRGTGATPSHSALLTRYEKLSAQQLAASNAVRAFTKNVTATRKNHGDVHSAMAKVNAAKTREALLNLQTTTAGSEYQSAVLTPASESSLSIIQRASVIDDDHSKTIEVFAIAGAIGGLLVALVLANLLSLRVARKKPTEDPSV